MAARPDGRPAGPGLVHQADAGSQYTSFAFTAHLIEAGIDAWMGTWGRLDKPRAAYCTSSGKFARVSVGW